VRWPIHASCKHVVSLIETETNGVIGLGAGNLCCVNCPTTGCGNAENLTLLLAEIAAEIPLDAKSTTQLADRRQIGD
jgi:hypothetical protein